MTEPATTADDRDLLRRAAAAHASAAADIEAFLRRLPEVPGAAEITEYANLVTREERLRADREAAADAAGLVIGSLESDQGT
ncbi:hypothetical protein [Micromonospora globbae]|uniref:Uncharacterized protein n=1 Tax=Micromonospora globbae TaxID=1894969 RepID=A0A420F7L1_9ACTN|nr:hypothetical protein [Micromonospora globbae]RKF28891.1 hypothetical protein D7I43_03960 [Micromonospora globbae]